MKNFRYSVVLLLVLAIGGIVLMGASDGIRAEDDAKDTKATFTVSMSEDSLTVSPSSVSVSPDKETIKAQNELESAIHVEVVDEDVSTRAQAGESARLNIGSLDAGQYTVQFNTGDNSQEANLTIEEPSQS